MRARGGKMPPRGQDGPALGRGALAGGVGRGTWGVGAWDVGAVRGAGRVARGAWRVARAELWTAVGLRRGAGLKARAGRTPAGSTTC